MDVLTVLQNIGRNIADFFNVLHYTLDQIGVIFTSVLRPINYVFILVKNALLGFGTSGTIDPDATYTFSTQITDFFTSIPGVTTFRIVLIAMIYLLLAVTIIRKAHAIFS